MAGVRARRKRQQDSHESTKRPRALSRRFIYSTFAFQQIISSFVDNVVSQALNKSRSVNDGEATETLLDHLIQETRDPKVLKDEVLNVSFSASRRISPQH